MTSRHRTTDNKVPRAGDEEFIEGLFKVVVIGGLLGAVGQQIRHGGFAAQHLGVEPLLCCDRGAIGLGLVGGALTSDTPLVAGGQQAADGNGQNQQRAQQLHGGADHRVTAVVVSRRRPALTTGNAKATQA